jgi:hypothetical protein
MPNRRTVFRWLASRGAREMVERVWRQIKRFPAELPSPAGDLATIEPPAPA